MVNKKKQTKSARADGRGGWVPGKRRHPDVGDWQTIRIGLVSLLNDCWRRNVRSTSRIATLLGVDRTTVGRWLSGDDRPAPEVQEWLRTWLTEQRAAVKEEAARAKRAKKG